MKFDPESGFPSFVPDRSNSTAITDVFEDIGLSGLRIFPGVFNPASSFSGKFLAKTIGKHGDLFAGASVLDVGCGCGVLGLACLAAGARSLTATDISPNAARNAKWNAQHLGFEVNAVSGDLFDSVNSSEFDYIIFNPPGFDGVPASEVEAHYKCPISVIERFWRSAPSYLSKQGAILSATSEIHETIRSPKTFASKFGYVAELLNTAQSQFGKQYAYLIRPNV